MVLRVISDMLLAKYSSLGELYVAHIENNQVKANQQKLYYKKKMKISQQRAYKWTIMNESMERQYLQYREQKTAIINASFLFQYISGKRKIKISCEDFKAATKLQLSLKKKVGGFRKQTKNRAERPTCTCNWAGLFYRNIRAIWNTIGLSHKKQCCYGDKTMQDRQLVQGWKMYSLRHGKAQGKNIMYISHSWEQDLGWRKDSTHENKGDNIGHNIPDRATCRHQETVTCSAV